MLTIYHVTQFTQSGGSWNSRLDGEDPTDNQTMINTAIRTVKDQVGLDLSYCKTWYRMLEVRYISL